ncbi:hypothetical protein ACGFIU_09340 [Rhodococcus oryzae]
MTMERWQTTIPIVNMTLTLVVLLDDRRHAGIERFPIEAFGGAPYTNRHW